MISSVLFNKTSAIRANSSSKSCKDLFESSIATRLASKGNLDMSRFVYLLFKVGNGLGRTAAMATPFCFLINKNNVKHWN
jgi:hypothetical protein